MKKLYALNLGSTSTKVAYSEDGQIVFKESIPHRPEEFSGCTDLFDQHPLRLAAILANMGEHGIELEELDAIVARGGLLQPLNAGVYQVNDAMVEQLESCEYGLHPASIGCVIAKELAGRVGILALTADVPSSDEMLPVARYTGLPEMKRNALAQVLNGRAVVREWAASRGKAYDEVNAIVVGLGGGISVVAYERGRMVDANNGVDGEGCFSTNRCMTVPTGQLVAACYSGERNYEQMRRHVSSEAGLVGYLGTPDMREIEQRIAKGDAYADEVVSAMCYQIAKDVGAFATVLAGRVDAIILAGGMAHSELVTGRIVERVKWIAPVVVRPGELEMEALCENAYRALAGLQPIQQFVPAANLDEAIEAINAHWA